MVTAGTLEIDVVLNGKKARLGLNDLKKRLGILNKTAFQTNKIFGKLAKVASIGFLAKMSLDTAKLNRELGLMADRTGMSFESLSKMRNSFKAFGGDAKIIDRVVSRISGGLARLSLGDGTLVSQLASLGINAWGAGNKLKTPEMLLGDIADKIVEYKSLGRTDAEIFALLQSIIPELDDTLYAQLSQGSEKYFETLEKTKTLNDEQRKSLEGLNQAWARLKTIFGTLYDRMISWVAPALEDFVSILEKFVNFASEHEKISAVITAVVGLVTALKGLSIASSIATSLGGLKLGLVGLSGAVAVLAAKLAIAGAIGYGIGYYGTKAVKSISNLFDSDEEKAQRRDNELATQANSMNFGSIEEKLKWLAEQGSPFYQKQYEKYMRRKYPNAPSSMYTTISDTKPYYENPALKESLINGNEVTQASLNNGLNIVVDVDNSISDNGDGSYTIETTTDIDNGFNSFTQKSMNTVNGGI